MQMTVRIRVADESTRYLVSLWTMLCSTFLRRLRMFLSLKSLDGLTGFLSIGSVLLGACMQTPRMDIISALLSRRVSLRKEEQNYVSPVGLSPVQGNTCLLVFKEKLIVLLHCSVKGNLQARLNIAGNQSNIVLR